MQTKGPRLYWRRGRRDSRTGKPLNDVWVIRDGQTERSTGCGIDGLREAEAALAAYIAKKWNPGQAGRSPSDPTQVLLADVLALYGSERADELGSEPAAIASRLERLLAWWGDKSIAHVRRSTCKAYAAHRQTQADARYKDPIKAPRVSAETARRELEDLSAAIGFWSGEHKLTSRPEVWLPEKPESPRDALTRDQAAALLKAARGGRWTKKGGWARAPEPARTNRLHLRRFALIGLYTGNRHKVTLRLLWEESATHPWADIETGIIYRRGKRVREAANKKTPVVKIPPRLLVHMRRWRAADRVLEAKRRETAKDYRLVSVMHYGGEPIGGMIRTGFTSCVRDAGLPEEVTPHWMRHTAATWLMEAGVDVWTASGYLGMTPDTLTKHYGHRRPDYQAGAAKASGGRQAG